MHARELEPEVSHGNQPSTDQRYAWIKENPDEAQRMIRDELRAQTRAEVSAELTARAWQRMTLTHETSLPAFQHMLSSAQQAGFLRTAPDLSRLIEPP